MHEDLINWTLAGHAFGIGVFSALSLILGAITARFWIPEDRTVAALMAFGGGALLAALTIDLVAPSLATGHFPHLSIGMFLGGGMFMLLNDAVNDYGGFLRKVSTTVYHLRRGNHSQYKRILVDVGRIDLFFAEAGHGAHTVIEGVAAGAMLTMIAQTMLPEAYLKGGAVVGLSTLAGFIAALFFKTLETGF